MPGSKFSIVIEVFGKNILKISVAFRILIFGSSYGLKPNFCRSCRVVFRGIIFAYSDLALSKSCQRDLTMALLDGKSFAQLVKIRSKMEMAKKLKYAFMESLISRVHPSRRRSSGQDRRQEGTRSFRFSGI